MTCTECGQPFNPGPDPCPCGRCDGCHEKDPGINALRVLIAALGAVTGRPVPPNPRLN